MAVEKIPSSFRDPSGFMFCRDGVFYRQINRFFGEQFDKFMSSGLYDALVKKGLLLRHEKVDDSMAATDNAWCIIRPEQLKFISYPYEWSFSQFKDAALATLEIQKIALKHDFVLKDASAYNIQFVDSRPVFIDTLSFEPYRDGSPWVGYRQFCQHFLAPLAMMTYCDVRLGKLTRNFIDGVPLDLAVSTLPKKTKFNMGLLMHLHLHAASQSKYADSDKASKGKEARISKFNLTAMIDNLIKTVSKLRWKQAETEWGEYYTFTNYDEKSFEEKHKIVSDMIDSCSPKSVWDLGANNGEFTRLASRKGIFSIAFDIDPVAVEKNYLTIRKDGEMNLLPLVMDLTNPSPALGWAHEERSSFEQRGPAGMVLSLALIHHLAISNNLPLEKIATFFAKLGKTLVMEFVPKEDSQVKKLLASREDIFPDYSIEGFENAFFKYFKLLKKQPVSGTVRTMYLLETQQQFMR